MQILNDKALMMIQPYYLNKAGHQIDFKYQYKSLKIIKEIK